MPMTAPSIKEALKAARQFIENGVELGYIKMPDADTPDPAHQTLSKIIAALATFQPDGERREAIALALAEKWPGDYMQGDDECEREPNALAYETADLILASGLVQDEAGWRDISTAPKDMTEIIVLCGQKDVRLGWYFAPSSTTFGWLDQRAKPIKPTHWIPLPPIRSARDGGAET